MSISFGNKNVKEMYFGNKKVAKVYFGNKLVWELDSKDPIDTTCIVQFEFNDNVLSWNVYAADGITLLNSSVKSATLSIKNSSGEVVYQEKHSFADRTFSMESYEDDTYNARIDVFGFKDGESLWKPWDGYNFIKSTIIDFLLNDSDVIFVEYTPEADITPSEISFWTSNTGLQVNSGWLQIFDDVGFCIYSEWNPASSTWSLGSATVNSVACCKETHYLQTQITLKANTKYYISMAANRWGEHKIGYYDEEGSVYKSTAEPIDDPEVGGLDPDATYLGEVSTLKAMAELCTEDNVGSYLRYTGPSFFFCDGSHPWGAGLYTINGNGTYLGETADIDNFAGSRGDCCYGKHSYQGAGDYKVYCRSDNEWVVENAWGSDRNFTPFSPVKGFSTKFANLEKRTGRHYKIEVK